MRKKIIYFIIFINIVFLIDKIIASCFEKAYISNTCIHCNGELNTYLKSNEKYDYIFLGSSRVSTMIDPEIVDTLALNLSQPARHFYYHCAVADLLNKKNKMPNKKLIVNIELEDVYIENEEYMINDIFYLKYYYNNNEYIRKKIQSKGFSEKIKFQFSSYRFNGENLKLFTNPLQGICKKRKKCFSPQIPSEFDSIKLMEDIKELNKIQYSKINYNYLNEIINLKKLCNKNSIELVLLIGPHYYRNKYFKKAGKITLLFCKKLNIKTIYFDSNQNSPFSKKNVWKDYLHLNQESALLYSSMIRDSIKTK